ncbi:double-stranded RNA-binding protein 4-like isoform X1 [Cornus florida]|uniref:double-stranded RNA-binding protein 4-like isoform X1 n=1 Tax=Cornus florida TaxID=4283 RepID=UPI00289E8B1B|nr:double-stranded RNA-binding protein 4-like isoform X1 [Cornus florida]XP_059642709.1 double-stranded RNA-binding protein 4-like isoform X1 [Cornus florida]
MSEEGAGSQQLQPYTAESENTELLPQSSSDLQEHSRYKNRLQEYTQKSAIQLPVYQTNNEGSQHYPRFRSTVKVDGSSYTSPSTFSHRKAAEQDVARVALEVISKKTKDAQCPLIHELIQDPVFCKSILNEYASKMKLEKPTYNTIQQAGLLPAFVSSSVFNGGTYTGNTGKNKKEAEQLAARTVILSILDDSNLSMVISEIIKSKYRLYNALHKVEDSHNAFMPLVVKRETCSGLHPRPAIPVHEFKKPKLEPDTLPFSPILFVPPVMPQPLYVGSTSATNRNRKNKKKAKKKVRVDPELPVAVLPSSHVPPCSVAQ